VRETVSDPIADAVLAARLFADSWQSLAAAARDEPELPALYAFCFGEIAGLRTVFAELGGRRPMSAGEARDYLCERFREQACGPALAACAAPPPAFISRERTAPPQMAHRATVVWSQLPRPASLRWIASERGRQCPSLCA
jgi:hypothetical protein